MCEKVTRPCIKAVSCSLAIALVEIAKLVSNLNTLVLSLAFFGSGYAGGGDKDQKNESDKKTKVDLDLVFCACGGNPAGVIFGSRCLL